MSKSATEIAIEALNKRTWARDQFPFPSPSWMPLGFLSGRHSLTSQAYYLSALQRAAIAGGFDVAPYVYIPTSYPPGNATTGILTLAAQDSADLYFTPAMDTSIVTGTFSANYESETALAVGTIDIFRGLGPDGKPTNKWNRSPVNLENLFGTGQNPMLYKPPIMLAGGEQILVRVTSALTVSMDLQICWLGLIRVQR